MSLSLLTPIAGIAAGTLALASGKPALERGTSFLNLLRGGSGANSNASGLATAATAIPENVRASLARLNQALQQRFAAAGIDTSQPIRLTQDSFGDVVTDTQHPDRNAIEQIFHDDPVLSSEFRDLHAAIAQSLASVGGASGANIGLVLEGGNLNVDMSNGNAG